MSAGEVALRVQSTLRDAADASLVSVRQPVRPLTNLLDDSDGTPPRLWQQGDMAGCGHPDGTESDRDDWNPALTARAEAVVAHRLSFFDLDDCHLGDPIDWNRDHKHGVAAPRGFAPWIDYRDFRVTGDCKFVWEPNRHHHLVVLGRAYRATSDVRYARAAVEQLTSWLDQCPYGTGMNWRSPLELGVRLINWVWMLDLIRESGLVDGEFRVRLINSVYRHVWEIARKYSRGSSANNHLVGEAAGVFVATSYFRNLKNAARWRAQSREILCGEILRQTFPDGGTREQALGYHYFVLQFFVIAGIMARASGEDLPAAYWARVEKMFEFAAAMSEGGDKLPMFGDCDEGYILDLGGDRGDVRPWLAVGATLFERGDLKAVAGDFSETAWWLLEESGRERFDTLGEAPPSDLASRALPDSGLYLLQYGSQRPESRISAVFDCGSHGLGQLAAHGHADALSFTLRVFGEDVLVDPGTYDYFSHPRWREYFRSTRAHNAIGVDGLDQSVMAGPFMWSEKAEARCLQWAPSDVGGVVSGEHTGYGRLRDPVTHRRTLELDGPGRRLIVRDDIVARGHHEVDIYFHLAEHFRIVRSASNRIEIDAGSADVAIELDPRLSVRMLTGSEDPAGGWVSRGYHRKTPSTTLVGHGTSSGDLTLISRILVGERKQTSRITLGADQGVISNREPAQA
jgi:hypothetical protein